MNNQDRDKLSQKIGELMAINKSQWPGTPFTAEDGSFGLTAGKMMGGLYDLYSLIDALAAGGVFRGRQNPGTDLDAASYTLSTDKVFHVYDEVDLFWNKDKELQVTIRTDAPPDKILKAVDGGIARKQEELRRRAKEEQDYNDGIARDKERDKLPTVFSPEADEALAEAYIAMRVRENIPSSNLFVSSGPIDAELSRLLNDIRPRIRVDYDLAKNATFAPVNDFNNELLPAVLTGHMAVGGGETSTKGRLYVEVAGPPARLVADILENDIDGAHRAAKELSGKVSQEMQDRILREIARRDNVGSILNTGLKNDTPAPAAATFKRRP